MAKKTININDLKKNKTPNELIMVRIDINKTKNGTTYKLIYE